MWRDLASARSNEPFLSARGESSPPGTIRPIRCIREIGVPTLTLDAGMQLFVGQGAISAAAAGRLETWPGVPGSISPLFFRAIRESTGPNS